MKRIFINVVVALSCLSVAAPSYSGPLSSQPPGQGAEALLWLAQDLGSDGGGYDKAERGRTPDAGAALNKDFTDRLVGIINDANETCGSDKMAAAYRVDCLRIYYGWVADQLPDRSDYAPIKKAMRQAEAKLDRIVRANLDTKAPVIEPKEGFKRNAKRLPPVRAVKKTAAKKVARQAEVVVKEAELAIIRSGGDPARRAPHFNAVAEAVDDNLVILRSA